MKYLYTLLCFLCFVTLSSASFSADEEFAVQVAQDQVDITVGFTGSSIELFGDRRDKDSIVAIVIEGPEKDVTLWEKARVLGTWVNRHYVTFSDIPSYYHFAISEREINDETKALMMQHAIGHDGLFARVETKNSKSVKDISRFSDAFLKKKEDGGAYFTDPAPFIFINENFFRVSFDVPPSASIGDYKIRSYLIKDGKLAEREVTYLKVEQVGMNAFLFESANQYSVLYALFCIFLAMFSGWLVSVLRVRP
ncbi:MAG: TIGR02186 family protein [Alphaproteobacteria bacterium]